MIVKILQNVVFLLTGQVIAKIIALMGMIVLARQLGVAGFGMYNTIMTTLTLFATFADGGLNTTTIRDVARDYAKSDTYFSHVLVLRTTLTILAYGMLLLFGSLWSTQRYPWSFLAVCGLFLFPDAFRKLGISMLTAYERMEIVAIMDVVAIVFRYAPFLLVIWLGHALPLAFRFFVVSWAIVAGMWMIVVRRHCLTQWFTGITFSKLKHILHESFPFWVFFVLSVIYFKADILMLATMQGDMAVGLYEAAYKFIEASMFVPVSIINVLLPVMSRMFIIDKSTGHHVYIHASRILGISILPVIIGISFFSRDIINLVFEDPNYLPAAPALSLLIWALLIIFLNAPVGNTIASSDRVHAYLPYAIGNTLLNIVLNVWFIRRYSYMGAAFTTVLTECTGFATQLWFAHRIMGGAPDILKILAKLLITGGMTSLVLAMVKFQVLFPFNALIAGGVYIACLFALKLIDQRDFFLVREEIQRIRAKHFPQK